MKTQYMVVVVVKSNDVIVYLVTDFTTFQEVGVAPVGDYLSSHTHLLRVTSSLQAIVNLNKPTIGILLYKRVTLHIYIFYKYYKQLIFCQVLMLTINQCSYYHLLIIYCLIHYIIIHILPIII